MITHANSHPEYDSMSLYIRPDVSRRLFLLPSEREHTNILFIKVHTYKFSSHGLRTASKSTRVCCNMKPLMTVTNILHSLFSGNFVLYGNHATM